MASNNNKGSGLWRKLRPLARLWVETLSVTFTVSGPGGKAVTTGFREIRTCGSEKLEGVKKISRGGRGGERERKV